MGAIKEGEWLPLSGAAYDLCTTLYFDNNSSSISIGSTAMFIDPKTLKPCKHRWEPEVEEGCAGWTITPKCRKCGITGSPEDASLRKLVKQLG